MVNRLRAMRGPGESYSDVILRLIELRSEHESTVIGSRPSGLPFCFRGHLREIKNCRLKRFRHRPF
jgi:hypothetical protein